MSYHEREERMAARARGLRVAAYVGVSILAVLAAVVSYYALTR